jgi:peptidoglycan/xylan/chitin deacetylase (PgdA/CDA1 family)
MRRAVVVAASAALSFAGPATSSGLAHDQPVPILMYHVVSAPPPGATYPELYVRWGDFSAEMSWLARHGFHAVTLDRVYAYWTKGSPLPKRPVVLSFDDGYLSQYTHAFHTLSRRHWPGVINLAVGHLRPLTGLRPWRIRKLIAAGWEIDAHTITHVDLTTVDDVRLRREVAGSRTLIRREFHVPVDFFCYPSGRYNARVIAEVRRAGFLGATTTNYGLAAPPDYYTLSRIRINGSDGLRGFATKLEPALASR